MTTHTTTMKNGPQYSSLAAVDLEAIKNNVRHIIKQSGVQIMAVVKANAYGHGAVPVAKAALEAGASWCAVARPDEALELRQAGLECPILLLGFTPEGRVEEMISARISLTAWDPAHVETISASAKLAGETARLHLKVDTGMNRLGSKPEAAPALSKIIAKDPHIHFEGIFTHFARADEEIPTPTDIQEQHFLDVLTQLEAEKNRPGLIHASNSSAGLTRPSAHFNIIRFGIAMYGLQPSPECPLPPTYRPALTWKSRLSQVKTVPSGEGVSYGHTYVTTKAERIGTIPVGYADGFRRVEGSHVIVRGAKVPVVGRVCMDQIMVQLDGVPDALAGDEVVLLGKQGDVEISADDHARQWGTINYEVVCGISSRVPRIMI